jgi:sialic acid synthase SpsE
VAIGAEYVERHFTDGQSRSPDNDFAMKPFEWREMVNEVMETYKILGDGNKKVEENEEEERIIQRRTWYAVKDIKAGAGIDSKDIALKRPALQTGLSASYILVGDLALRDISAGEVITSGDIQAT